jgi:hypothetical protein
MHTRPTLLNSCARATTAAEARFRIDIPIAPSRATRVVALDQESADVVRRVSERSWATARFYVWDGAPISVNGNGASPDALRIQAMDGSAVTLGDELDGVDAAVMVASTDEGAAAASSIGLACTLRGIMTAGLVLSDSSRVSAALSALRPHARVLMVPAEEEDLVQLLTALRA